MLSALEWEALSLSLKVACVAVGLSLIPGFAAAWWLARREFRGKALVDGLLHLPDRLVEQEGRRHYAHGARRADARGAGTDRGSTPAFTRCRRAGRGEP